MTPGGATSTWRSPCHPRLRQAARGPHRGGRDWGATSSKRSTNETRRPNAQSGAFWGTVWETRLEMLLARMEWPLLA
jgi:hypothetical protein